MSLFDVVDETSVSAKLAKSNGGGTVMNHNSGNNLVNSWTGKPFSQRYFEILEKRKTLPVWHQKEEFLQVLKTNQTLILVGETGSGKTTQVSLQAKSFFLPINLLFKLILNRFRVKRYRCSRLCFGLALGLTSEWPSFQPLALSLLRHLFLLGGICLSSFFAFLNEAQLFPFYRFLSLFWKLLI